MITCAVEAMSAVHNGPQCLFLLLAVLVESSDGPTEFIDSSWLWRLTAPSAGNLHGRLAGHGIADISTLSYAGQCCYLAMVDCSIVVRIFKVRCTVIVSAVVSAGVGQIYNHANLQH